MNSSCLRYSTPLILSCSWLCVAGLPARACSTTGSVVVTNLPGDLGSGFQVTALNAGGQLTGYFYPVGNANPHAFFYSDGVVADLGTLGGPVSEGLAINNNGAVAGASYLSNYEFHSFLSDSNGFADLGTLGGTYSTPTALNDAGQVAGGSYTTGDATVEAFLYSGGQLVSLGSLGGEYSFPFDLNASGMVVGESSLSNGDVHAFLYAAGTMADLGTLGSNYSSAFSVNSSGVVVGPSILANGQTHGFVYSAGAMTDIGTLGGTYSCALSVNAAGQVIGNSTIANDAETHPFIYSGGQLTDLGTLGGTAGYAAALNSKGQVVGYAILTNGTAHAFVWAAGQMVDLNALLPSGSGWELNSAQFINDAGRIVGMGTLNGVAEPFILDIAPANQAPVAVAGPDQLVQCSTQVLLDGSASFDPDGDALTYQWSLAGTVLGTNSTLVLSLPMGTNLVTLQVTDPCGASSQTNVAVVVADSTPPVVQSLRADPDVLWPPNHRLIPVSVLASARDDCDPAPASRILCVNCDQTVPARDIQVTGPLTVKLAASRNAHERTRHYTIVVGTTDSSGNIATNRVVITVPRDRDHDHDDK
jgi:probable HAF family extracellular repeat protein